MRDVVRYDTPMEYKPTGPDDTLPPTPADLTHPDIQLPPMPTPEAVADNPLEVLVPDVETRVSELETRLALLNRYMQGRVIEYGGMTLRDPQFTLDLALQGTDGNGIPFVIPPGQVDLFLESLKPRRS
jgi:hypothetical protein